MVPKDNIARTPISTGSFVKSYVSGTGGPLPAAAAPALGTDRHHRQNPRADKIGNFTAGWNVVGRKIPGSGGTDPGTGVRDAGPKTFLNSAAVSNSSGALPAKRETQVGWPSPALCRETRSLSGA